MGNEATTVATLALLSTLLLRLERERIVADNFIDEVMNGAMGVIYDAAPANEEAIDLLHEVWSDLNKHRDFARPESSRTLGDDP